MKKVKRLKHKLGVSSRKKSSLGAFDTEKEHFELVERSLLRLQAASAAWAGALDAFGAATQGISEELARHTMLLATPLSSASPVGNTRKNDKESKASNADPANICRALHEIMTSVDKIFHGIHDVFLETELRPLINTMGMDVREIRSMLDDHSQKASQYRALSKSKSGSNSGVAVSTSPDENDGLVSNYKPKRGKKHRLELAERSLRDSTEQCSLEMSLFQERQINSVPESVGALLGCYYSLASRVAADVQHLLPSFPQAACAMVDIATGSENARSNNERRQRERNDSYQARKQQEESRKRIRQHMSVNSFPGDGKSNSGQGSQGSGKSTAPNLRSGKWRPVSSTTASSIHTSTSSIQGEQQDQHQVACRKRHSAARPKAPGKIPTAADAATKDEGAIENLPYDEGPLPTIARKSIAKRFSSSLASGFRAKPGAVATMAISAPVEASLPTLQRGSIAAGPSANLSSAMADPHRGEQYFPDDSSDDEAFAMVGHSDDSANEDSEFLFHEGGASPQPHVADSASGPFQGSPDSAENRQSFEYFSEPESPRLSMGGLKAGANSPLKSPRLSIDLGSLQHCSTALDAAVPVPPPEDPTRTSIVGFAALHEQFR